MSDNRKEQERAELHRTIWGIANDLRGSVDGWDFKQYVLGILFYRYISENITVYINEVEHAAGNASFDYVGLSDIEAEQIREELVTTKGSENKKEYPLYFGILLSYAAFLGSSS